MSNGKNKTWVNPSFDFSHQNESRSNVSSSKRLSSQVFNNNPVESLVNSFAFKKRTTTSNLSTLLTSCEPNRLSELAISKQKQQEISQWFMHRTKKGKPSVLVISGPSGSGKTMAIKVIAKDNGFNILEWINPIDQVMDENNRITRQGNRFEEYLIRATRYNSVLTEYSRQLLLVKDFPNVYLQDKDSFFVMLEKYFEMGREPIVFVCTETGNSKTLQTLFPPEIRQKYGIDLININSVTPTAMKNVLKRISGILNSSAGHLLQVTQDKVEEVLSNNIGDVRSAILNLVFISLKVSGIQKENECSGRVESLGLLHGIGRVINPKRIVNGDTWKFVHDPDEIVGFFQSHATIFVRFLHENYLNTMRDIEQVDKCADILSMGDILSSEWRDTKLGKVTLSLCIRGVMVTNDNPVAGWNPVRKPQNDQSSLQRNLSAAEMRWYSSIIKPSKDDRQQSNLEIDGIIEQ